ncbi:MAG: RNB domain-containing ribonuclease [bacterium]|nr:RNB domain-containing ribonuclease [bacterium]
MSIKSKSLVIYKNSPAKVISIADKLEIELINNKIKKVRNKDVILLHTGPFENFSTLKKIEINDSTIKDTWELLQETSVDLEEFSDLIFGEYTLSSAWSCWNLLYNSLYFQGDVNEIKSKSEGEVKEILAKKQLKENEQTARNELLARIQNGKILPEDSKYMREIENVALGKTTTSRLMQELNREQIPEKAHSLLLNTNFWDNYINPYPQRFNILNTSEILPDIPELPEEERCDLTHLSTYAIDDEGCTDPDDALSFDNGYLWVHIADVASIVTPGSELDQYAVDRGSNLYMPERIIPMLPNKVTEILGLGLTEKSPALSFKIKLDDEANSIIEEIVPSWIKVTRLSYKEANEQINTEPLNSIYELTKKFKNKRIENNSIELNLPEVKIKLNDKNILFSPVLPLKSRDMVVNAMLMTGEAVGNFAIQNDIPIPFATQNVREEVNITSNDLSEMFGCRKKLKPAILQTTPEKHSGLGLNIYVQTTSPLRRYLDLLIHQQLRAYLKNEHLMDEETVSRKISKVQPLNRDIRMTERLSNRHWTLVYLESSKWRGEAVLAEKYGSKGTFIIPELAFETRIPIDSNMELDSKVKLAYNEMNLANLIGNFLIEE